MGRSDWDTEAPWTALHTHNNACTPCYAAVVRNIGPQYPRTTSPTPYGLHCRCACHGVQIGPALTLQGKRVHSYRVDRPCMPRQ